MLGNSGIVVIDKFFSCLVCMTSIERKACMMVVVVVICLRLQHQIFAIAAPAKVHFFR